MDRLRARPALLSGGLTPNEHSLNINGLPKLPRHLLDSRVHCRINPEQAAQMIGASESVENPLGQLRGYPRIALYLLEEFKACWVIRGQARQS